MNKPLTKAEIEMATELHVIPRYVIVRKMSGYDYAPVTHAAHEEHDAVNTHVAAKPARNWAEARLPELVLIFLVTFIGSVATASIAAGLAVKIVSYIN